MSVVEIEAISPQAPTRHDAGNADNVQTGITPGNSKVITAVIRCAKCRAMSNYVMISSLAQMVSGFVQYRCGGCGKSCGGRVMEWRETVAGDPPAFGAPRLALRARS